MTLPHLPSYPRLKGPPWLEPGSPGSSPDNPIPPEGIDIDHLQGPLTLCYGENGWVLIPNPQVGQPRT